MHAYVQLKTLAEDTKSKLSLTDEERGQVATLRDKVHAHACMHVTAS